MLSDERKLTAKEEAWLEKIAEGRGLKEQGHPSELYIDARVLAALREVLLETKEACAKECESWECGQKQRHHPNTCHRDDALAIRTLDVGEGKC